MIIQAISQLGNVVKLLNPVMTIIQGIMDVLGPLINNLLQPLVGILKIVGQTIGKILAPALKLLRPIITAISKIFIWLYNKVVRPVYNTISKVFTWLFNKVIRPIYNGIMTVFNKIIRGIQSFINGIIKMINKIPGVSINKINKRSVDAGHLDKKKGSKKLDRIAMENLQQGTLDTDENKDTDTGGKSASYTSGTKITVEEFKIQTDVITGEDGGFDQLVRMIMKKMNEIEALA